MLTWTGPAHGSRQPVFQIAFGLSRLSPIQLYRNYDTAVLSSRSLSSARVRAIDLRPHPGGRSGRVRPGRREGDDDPRRGGGGRRLARAGAALLPVEGGASR